jgi:hypothetical protein
MISRAQRILFAFLLIGVVIMAAVLIRLRERAQDRLHAIQQSAPLIEDQSSAPQSVLFYIPNDLDGSLQETQRSLPLPPDDSTRARVLLEALIDTFRDPHSTHPIALPASDSESSGPNPEANTGLDGVFLMPVPQPSGSQAARSQAVSRSGTLAVVDFSAAFAASHPSGIEAETLTLLSVIQTLHANIPTITQVHFLIDGHPAETLAGHADLTRTYLTSETPTPTGTQQP